MAVGEFDKDRTRELRVLGFPTRNLANVQMTTDTALIVADRILSGGRAFEELEFVDRPEFFLRSPHESVIMPFRYLKREDDGGPLLAPGVIDIIRSEDGFSASLLE